MCEKRKKNTLKEVKMHKFLVCAYKYQDFAQSRNNFARSHDRETVTIRNSGLYSFKRRIRKPQKLI